MPRVTIFLPVSRDTHLDRLFASLELLNCDAEQTSILSYVDGPQSLFERTDELTQALRFTDRRAVRRADHSIVSSGLMDRRKRIAIIKNESKSLIGDCTFVFGIEDDTIVPPHALQALLDDYAAYPHAGFIEGVELGRWGIPYVGAWRADDPYEPTKIDSVLPDSGRWGIRPDRAEDALHTPASRTHAHFLVDTVEEIDAGGFYCYLTRRENYVAHDYAPFGRNVLGPDVNYGLWLRQQGFKNYIDWSVSCEHRQPGGGRLSLQNTTPKQVSVVKKKDYWQQVIAHD